MSLPVYMGHHVRGAVSKGLRRRGIDVLTVSSRGCADATDDELLARRRNLGESCSRRTTISSPSPTIGGA